MLRINKKLLNKLLSVLLVFIMTVSVFTVVPVSVSAVSYRENIIDAILKHENDWTNNWYYGGYYGDGTFEFIDLNFDGNLEFVVTYPCGSMRNISRNIYYFSGGKLCKAGGGDKSDLVSGYSGLKLTGYYDKNTNEYKLLGSSFLSAYISDWTKGNYSLFFDGKDIEINYYSAETMDSDYGKINPPLHKYYNGAYSFGNLGDANEISESEYNAINSTMVENCIDINLSSKAIESSAWKNYLTSEKRKTLEESYDSLKYDKYNNYFKLKQDTNQYLHKSTTYYINNKDYRNKLYWDSLNTWDSTFRIYDEIYSGETGGVCHGIALSMCYANTGNLDLIALNNGKQANNYWELGSIYDSNKSKFKDLVTYYQLTQRTANGRESYSVTKNGWHTQSLYKRLSDFLKKFKQEAERSQNEKKPFVFSFGYKHDDEVTGHSVVACGYNYNKSTNEHEILIYDENTYPVVRYSTFKISSDYSSFSFTDANGEALGYMVSDIWTYLKVYSIDKLYSGKAFSSITVVKGSEPVSASNTTQLNITAYKTFKVMNDKGEYLEYDGNNYSGNMDVYDCKIVDNSDNTCSWNITVNNSSKFEFSNLENDCEIIGETYSGGFFVSSNDSDGFTVNGKSVTVEGENYDFDIALQTQSEKDFIRVSGKASGNTSVSDNNNKIEMKSDTYINAANVKSYEFDNISENDVENTVNNIIIDDESGGIVDSKKLSYTFGDINNDGAINSKDRMTLTRYIAKWNGFNSINNLASDVNYDGKVNAKDRMIITRYLAKWNGYISLPYTG